jgi:hypothetical protein
VGALSNLYGEARREAPTPECFMSAHADATARWEARRDELSTLHAQVDGAALVSQFLRDLDALIVDEPPVSLAAAAKRTGYSADHLSRLIRTGKLTDHGRKHAPRVRISECPKKVLAIRSSQAYNADTDARLLVSASAVRRKSNAS